MCQNSPMHSIDEHLYFSAFVVMNNAKKTFWSMRYMVQSSLGVTEELLSLCPSYSYVCLELNVPDYTSKDSDARHQGLPGLTSPRLFLIPYQCLSPPDSTGMLGRIIFAWWKG